MTVRVALLGGLLGTLTAACSEPSRKPLLMPDQGARVEVSDQKRAVTESSLRKRPAPPTRVPAPAAPGRLQQPVPSGIHTLSDVAERTVRSVVNVRSTSGGSNTSYSRPDWYGRVPERRPNSLGSGVIVSADGLILTNHHVIRKATDIRITLSDNKELRAVVIGSDPKSDVAVLRVQDPPSDLVPIGFGDSKTLRLGEIVLAIGNPFGVGQTVTMGIVSAVGRVGVGIVDYEDFIQTDAAINPGNSGGALVNARGELVGINTAILSKSGGYQGIGFAIPTDMARPIMESLLKHGRVIRGWIGVMIQDLSQDLIKAMGLQVDHGVLVADVQRDSPAAKAGLSRGDVILSIDGDSTESVAQLRNKIASIGPGQHARLLIARGGRHRRVSVTLEQIPSETVATF